MHAVNGCGIRARVVHMAVRINDCLMNNEWMCVEMLWTQKAAAQPLSTS